MNKQNSFLSPLYSLQALERIIAISTGLIVAFITLTFEEPTGWVSSLNVSKVVVGGLLAIVIGYLLLEFFWDGLSALNHYRKGYFIIAFLATFLLMLLYDLIFVSILTILMVNRATHIYSLPTCLALAILPTLSGGLVNHFVHALPYSMASAILFVLFNLAILVIGFAVLSERREKEKSEKLCHELQATQYLLSEAAKQDERLHISRDLHDQVGHHLTALSLQLEVAINAPPEEAAPHVQRARDISRLLLSDIRATVSDIRSNTKIDIGRAIKNLIQPIDKGRVFISIPDDLSLHSTRTAECLFRSAQESLTNARKHTKSTRIEICICKNEKAYDFTYSDNGGFIGNFNYGNGLIGMKERVEYLGGEMEVITSQGGFGINLTIPSQEIYT